MTTANIFDAFGLKPHHIVAVCTALLVKGLVFLFWYFVRKMSDRFKINTKETAFGDLLNHFRDFCNTHYKQAADRLQQYTCTKGNEFDGKSIVNNARANINAIIPDMLFKEYDMLMQEKNAQRISSVLVDILYKLRFQHESLENFLDSFSNDYEKCQKEYMGNMFELSRVHDALKRQLADKQANKQSDPWALEFTGVFDQWFSNGANKDIRMLQNEIIVKVLALGRKYIDNPLAGKATEIALKGNNAFKNILKLDDDLRKKLKDYTWAYRRAAKVTAVIGTNIRTTTGKIPFLSGLAPVISIGKFSIKERAVISFGLVAIAGICFTGGLYFNKLKADFEGNPMPLGINKASADTIRVKAKDTVVATPITFVDSVVHLDTVSTVCGLDISKYQGNLLSDFKQLDTMHFIICKATQGKSLVDADFANNWRKLNQLHIIRGAYHFYMVRDDPAEQAQHFLKTVGTLGKSDIPLILDIEEESIYEDTKAADLQPALLTFLEHIEQQTGRKPVIYTDLSFANEYLRMAAFADYPLWLAEYSGKPSPVLPAVWKKKGHAFWQKNDTLTIDSRKTDFDVFNGNGAMFMEFIKHGSPSN